MGTLNLDAKRAARSEAENKPHTLILGGDEYELPPRMPLAFMDELLNMNFAGAMRLLLGDKVEQFMAAEPDVDDLMAIAEEFYALGDFLGGRPTPSPASSKNGGNPSKPTGKRTTAGTSRKTATASTTSGSGSS